jgi:hypothetical protein
VRGAAVVACCCLVGCRCSPFAQSQSAEANRCCWSARYRLHQLSSWFASSILLLSQHCSCCAHVHVAGASPCLEGSRHARKGPDWLPAFMFALDTTRLSRGGILALASRSSHIAGATFEGICRTALGRARRTGAVLGVAGQPADHPYPVACPELSYLKFVTHRLD